MDVSWALQPGQGEAVFAIAVASAAYAAYHYGAAAGPIARWIDARARGRWSSQASAVIARRLAGVLLLGGTAIAAIAVLPGSLDDHGAQVGDVARAAIFFALISAIVVPGLLRNARDPLTWEYYPEIRDSVWTPQLAAANAFSWAAYLLAYELFFRGFLLFALVRSLGTWPGIAVTTAIYGCVHLHKNAREGIPSFPGGVLFAVSALLTGSILAPFAAHLVISQVNDAAVLRARRPTATGAGADEVEPPARLHWRS
jgi:membrane protease YdiL (CAAX protease family)